MQIGQKKTTGQKMKKERNRGRETDRKPNISQIQKTGEHCIYAKRCGGCDYQGILYSQQLSKKQSYMRKLMEPFGKINPIIGMDDPYHYRHKVQAAFSCNKRGHIVAGVYEKHSHDIVDVEQCQIEDAQADAIIREIKNMMRSFRIRAYCAHSLQKKASTPTMRRPARASYGISSCAAVHTADRLWWCLYWYLRSFHPKIILSRHCGRSSRRSVQ